jgi:hypothetical protein
VIHGGTGLLSPSRKTWPITVGSGSACDVPVSLVGFLLAMTAFL